MVPQAPSPDASAGSPWTPRWDQSSGLRWALAILSFFSAVIHFAVAGEHFQEWWVFGVLMLLAAWGQTLFGLGALLRPGRTLWFLGAALNLGIVVYYVITRTVGDLIGPTPLGPEAVGFGDVACTVAEVLVVLGCGWMLVPRRPRSVSLRQAGLLPLMTGVAVLLVLSFALVDGGPEMVMSAPTASTATSGAMASGGTTGNSSGVKNSAGTGLPRCRQNHRCRRRGAAGSVPTPSAG